MSYYTHLSGDLEIVPPLTYAEFRGSVWLEFKSPQEWRPFRLVVEEREEDADLGTVTIKTANKVESFYESASFRDISASLQALVDWFPGHEFPGCIEGEGENRDDMWRLYVRGGRVIRHTPTITWPDEPADDTSGEK